MKSPEDIEKALQRLMPPALSHQTHANVSAMIASLAAAESVGSREFPAAETIVSLPKASKSTHWRGAAAAVAIGAVSLGIWQSFSQPKNSLVVEPTIPLNSPPTEATTSPVLIDRMRVTDGVTVEGTLSAADGSMIQEVKRRVETRERYRDEKKGYLITISETRDEKVYMPKKGF